MTFSAKQYDTTITITTERDDLDATEAVQKVYELLLALGYHPDSLTSVFADFAMAAQA